MKPLLIILTGAILSGCVTSTAPDGTQTSRLDLTTASDALKLSLDTYERALAIKERRDDVLVTPEGKRIVPLQ